MQVALDFICVYNLHVAMTQIDEIKSRIDIVDLVGETVKLRRSGRNYSGLCPFHSEKTPSFIVSPERQTWRCFGQCNEGGDIFSFVMKKEGWDFGETLRHLAQKAGVTLEERGTIRPEEKEEHERLRQALEDASTYYRHQLLSTEEGKTALEYLRQKRQISEATIEAFGLGYAPRGWDNLLKHLASRGFQEEELVDSGLVTARAGEHEQPASQSRKLFDRFRERIMIPIRDANGKMAGFGARILRPDDFPKFLNSPETPLFSKGRILYGYDRARKAIRAADQAVIVEGYLDVIAVHQAGFENVVSPMGTALTEDQLRLLKRATRRIVLALDPDAAGQKAVLSGLEAARQSLDRANETGFDARGLLRHEARLQADLRVATMPGNLDPDELVQRDPAEWKRLIETAQPIVLHVMEKLAEGRDLQDAKVRSEIVTQVLPLIEDLPNPVERDTYRQRLARFLKVDERSLPETPAPTARARRGRPRGEEISPVQKTAAAEKPSIGSPGHKVEAHVLGALLRRPELLCLLDRALQENSLMQVSADDFTFSGHQALFRLVRESLEQDSVEPDQYLVEKLPVSLAVLMGSLLENAIVPDHDDRLLEDIFRSVLAMRRRIVDESLGQLRYLVETDKALAEPYHQMILGNTRTRQLLDRARLRRNGNR